MKAIILTIGLFSICGFESIAQINPISNLTWEHTYINMENDFELRWDEPIFPRDSLLGYNVYREDELYRFQTETSLNSLNCGIDFLSYGSGGGFYAHVTAVYYPGPVESGYTETVFVDEAFIGITDNTIQKAILYPNPSKGVINIGNNYLNEIQIYDMAGKRIKQLEPQAIIDLSDIPKGIYLIKLVSDEGILADKIILE